MSHPSFPFSVISGQVIHEILSARRAECLRVVREAYLAHGAGRSVNPNSLFLRFPDKPDSRIIALPAHLGEPWGVSGVKWIASFPKNVQRGFPRASAVLLLNNHEDGYPFACLESSIISAARTAASAWVAAQALGRGPRIERLGMVGNGLIARYVFDFLQAMEWEVGSISLFDTSPGESQRFAERVCAQTHAGRIEIHREVESLVRASDVLVLATTAGAPHLLDRSWFAHDPLVLNLSLRDLSPEILLGSNNVVDDIDHVMNAGTSPHLAERLCGDRRFVNGTIADAIEGRCRLQPNRPTIVSPFGLGVLDLAVGAWVHAIASEEGRLIRIEDFFFDLSR